MIIIETDYKHGTQREVTFKEAFISLIGTFILKPKLNTLGVSRVRLNALLLSNRSIENDRFAYRRKITCEGVR